MAEAEGAGVSAVRVGFAAILLPLAVARWIGATGIARHVNHLLIHLCYFVLITGQLGRTSVQRRSGLQEVLMKIRYRVHAVALAVLFLMLPSLAHAEKAYSCYCPNKAYVHGQYVCGDFADDFNKNCAAAGIKSCRVSLGFGSDVSPACQALGSHAMNIVNDPNPDLNPQDAHYCAVEPQTGQQWCWPQAGGGRPVIPAWIREAMFAHLGPAYQECYKQFSDKTWTDSRSCNNGSLATE
jgi:hypothetical protein